MTARLSARPPRRQELWRGAEGQDTEEQAAGEQGQPRLDFIAPLSMPGSGSPLVVLQISSSDWLNHILKQWPIPDSSGEALRVGLQSAPWLVKPNTEELGEVLDDLDDGACMVEVRCGWRWQGPARTMVVWMAVGWMGGGRAGVLVAA